MRQRYRVGYSGKGGFGYWPYEPAQKKYYATLLGNAWMALMGLVFVPLYIKFLGIESYGLIGFFAMLQVMTGLLDMGFSSTLNSEMARLSCCRERNRKYAIWSVRWKLFTGV